MERLEPELRAALRELVDLRRRATLAPSTVKAPTRYTRCKTEEERLERLRANYRAYYARNREARCAAERDRYWQRKAMAA